ncbi:MAG: hypothetical protein FJ387_10930 [Verrucomicrobia bacterium]|nr:hypothetical protein [Verrucomicrobiota bacterium]
MAGFAGLLGLGEGLGDLFRFGFGVGGQGFLVGAFARAGDAGDAPQVNGFFPGLFEARVEGLHEFGGGAVFGAAGFVFVV